MPFKESGSEFVFTRCEHLILPVPVPETEFEKVSTDLDPGRYGTMFWTNKLLGNGTYGRYGI